MDFKLLVAPPAAAGEDGLPSTSLSLARFPLRAPIFHDDALSAWHLGDAPPPPPNRRTDEPMSPINAARRSKLRSFRRSSQDA